MADATLDTIVTPPPQGERLESWKEIASYLGRDVTTVRRWERREGLPVHRLLHTKLGSVYAFTGELEAWRRHRSLARATSDGDAPESVATEEPFDGHPPRPDESSAGEGRVPRDTSRAAWPRAVGRPWPFRWIAVITGLIVVGAVAWSRFAGNTPPPPPTVPTIAVLPLRNLSGDPSQQYYADGMTEAVIARLAGIENTRVTSRTSVMQFRDVNRPISEIAAALKADVILEGSVVRTGNRVRLMVQLVDGHTDAHLWATEYDREVDDVLALQGELAEAIAARIQSTVQPATRTRATTARPVLPAAYELYLKGRYQMNAGTRESIRQSVGTFASAIAADPAFAQAYSAMAAAELDLNTGLVGVASARETTDRAIAAANQALAIDPELSEAHSVLGRAATTRFQWADAEASYKRALELNPSDARTHIWYAEWMVAHDRLQDAVNEARRGRDLDPLSLRVGAEYGLILYMARRFDEAAQQLHAVLAIQPDHPQASWWLGSTLVAQGKARESLPFLEGAVASSGRSPGIVSSLARAYAIAGRRNDAQRLLDELTERRQREYVPPTAMMSACIGLGERDRALDWLERAAADADGGIHLGRANPANDPIRDDPRFLAVFKRIGLR